jgi:hypothetical protein
MKIRLPLLVACATVGLSSHQRGACATEQTPWGIEATRPAGMVGTITVTPAGK